MTKSTQARTLLLGALAMLCLVVICSTVANAGNLFRLSAEQITPDEESTAALPADCAGTAASCGGASIYTKAVVVPAGYNVIYITMSTTGDTHFGAGEAFNCTVDGAPCLAFNVGAGQAPLGWIMLARHYAYDTTYNGGHSEGDGSGGTGDQHDNSIYYTWCVPVKAGAHTVNLRQAYFNLEDPFNPNGNMVFIEGGQFFIDADAQNHGAACRQGSQ